MDSKLMIIADSSPTKTSTSRGRVMLLSWVVLCCLIFTFLSHHHTARNQQLEESHQSLLKVDSGPLTNENLDPSRTRRRRLQASATGKEDDDEEGKFAYLFSITGCSTETSCLPFILNAVVAAQVLRHHQSIADIILLVRMSSSRIISDSPQRLSPIQEEFIQKAGIIIHYVPQVAHDDFAVLEKFRGLELTQYDRVLFIDIMDTVPRCNLDYIFEESYNNNGMLSGFVGLAGTIEPISTSSIFLVTPKAGEFTRLMKMIQTTIQLAGGANFDPIMGWGHQFNKYDAWRSLSHNILRKGENDGTKWDFKDASSDAGIILQYFKYVVMNYTQLYSNEVEIWQDVTGSESYWLAQSPDATTIQYIYETNKSIAKVKHTKDQLIGCNGMGDGPYSDIYHYDIDAGEQMPWGNVIDATNLHIPDNPGEDLDKTNFWLYHLMRANETFHLQLPTVIDFDVESNHPQGYDEDESSNDLFNYRREDDNGNSTTQGLIVDLPVPALEGIILGADDETAGMW